MIRPVLRMGDPRLLRVAKAVSPEEFALIPALLEDMRDTMRHLSGAGLAAPQIGVDLRVVIFGVQSNPRYPDAEAVPDTVLINPLIEALDPTQDAGWEGCLSVPGMRGLVPRYTRIRYSGLDAEGQKFSRIAENFHARVVQHECDHLDGVLYPMRIKDLRDFGFSEVLFPDQPIEDD